MIMVAWIGAMLLLLTATARADEFNFYVDGARGNDANDCMSPRQARLSKIRRGPCATIQAAVNKTKATGRIYVADWDQTYPLVSVTYYRSIVIVGNCDDPRKVKVAACIGADHEILMI